MRTLTSGMPFVFVLLFASLLAAEAGNDAHVVIDSLAGEAQVQRAGQQKWSAVKVGVKLFNNDVLRVREKSHARLLWTDGSVMYVHPNSQVLMNLYEDTANNFVTRHATVFFGAVFFVIKEVLPKALTQRYDTKVYTPTAVVSIRGTSFEVCVDEKGGATDVRVMNGTVLVGNILRQQSVFLADGYKTQVTMNAKPSKHKAIMTEDIESLRAWVPPDIVKVEMKEQIAQAKQDLYTITGKLEDKVLVMPFADASGYEGAWDIGNGLAAFLSSKMQGVVEGTVVRKAEKASDDVMKAGEAQRARFVLTGEVRGFEILQRASISVTADEYKEHCIARVRMYLQLVDVQNRTLVFAKEVNGEVSGKNMPENTWKEIAKLNFNMKDKKFAGTILAKAIEQAAEQSTSDMSRYLAQ